MCSINTTGRRFRPPGFTRVLTVGSRCQPPRAPRGPTRAASQRPGTPGPTAEASTRSLPGRCSGPLPAPLLQPGRPGHSSRAGRYRFRCSLKSAVSARRASRSWMDAGIMTPDSRTGSGLGAAILPMRSRETTTSRGRRSSSGREAGEGGRAPHRADQAAASAPCSPRPSREKARARAEARPGGGREGGRRRERRGRRRNASPRGRGAGGSEA